MAKTKEPYCGVVTKADAALFLTVERRAKAFIENRDREWGLSDRFWTRSDIQRALLEFGMELTSAAVRAVMSTPAKRVRRVRLSRRRP